MDELEIVTRFFILHIFARYVYVLPNYAFLRIYHDSKVVDGWTVSQLSSNRRREGVMIGRST